MREDKAMTMAEYKAEIAKMREKDAAAKLDEMKKENADTAVKGNGISIDDV